MPDDEGGPADLTAAGPPHLTPFQQERADRHARIKVEATELRRAGATWTQIIAQFGGVGHYVFTKAERAALTPPRPAKSRAAAPPGPPRELSRSTLNDASASMAASAAREQARKILDLRATGLRWDAIAAELGLPVGIIKHLAGYHFQLLGWATLDLTDGDGPPPEPDEAARPFDELPAGHPLTWGAISREPYPT